jgi:hypothetical protein
MFGSSEVNVARVYSFRRSTQSFSGVESKRFTMKRITIMLGAGLVVAAAGCSTTPVALAPVGPNPARSETMTATGELQVFSGLEVASDNQNLGGTDPVWYQHADYRVYDARGRLVARVDNKIGRYEQSPRRVALPPGLYLVLAPAKDYFQVEVPVIIERGRLTRVHLDDKWHLPPATPKTELVAPPNGEPVGWKADLMDK